MEKGRFNKIKINPFIIIFFISIIFCAFTLFPVQYILLYPKAIDRYNLAKRLLYIFLLNIIFMLINSNKHIRKDKEISLFLSLVLSIIYIFIIPKFKIIYQISRFSILRSLVVMLSLKYVLNALSIKEEVKASVLEPKLMGGENYNSYKESDLQSTKYFANNIHYWLEIQNKTANMELVSASVLIGCVAFTPNEHFLWIFLILIILSIIQLRHRRFT